MNPAGEQTYLIGLDLGQTSDPTALAVLERIVKPAAESNIEVIARERKGDPPPFDPPLYQARYLERFPLQTPYTQIADFVKQVCLRDLIKDNLRLVIDASGVGRGVMDMLRERLRDTGIYPYGITITGGDVYVQVDGGYRVPKRDLVSAVRIPLEENRLVFADNLPLLDDLKRELMAFRVKTTKSANDIYEAREGEHDDIVLAVALACWFGETMMAKGTPPPQSNTYNSALAAAMDRLNRTFR